jgi:hypothetical protein
MNASHLNEFYSILDEAKRRQGGPLSLSQCNGAMNWPDRGVYFFFEPGENRADSSSSPRVVRVGTHAVSRGSKATLWKRLRQHLGTRDGGGNHRGSVFRLLVGAAIKERDAIHNLASWGKRGSASREIRSTEREHEGFVSQHIGQMPLVVVEIDDEPSSQSMRSHVERNAIALLSSHPKSPKPSCDRPSQRWLGHSCPKRNVRDSGLWNSNHVLEPSDPGFLQIMEEHVGRTKRSVL